MTSKGKNNTEISRTCLVSWEGNSIIIPCEVKRYSKRIDKTSKIDFDELGISRNGLLEFTLISLEFPCHYKRFVTFAKAIKYLSANDDCREILSAHPNAISVSKIVWLYKKHEQYVESKLNRKFKKILGTHFRAYFKRVPEQIIGGGQIGHINFKSQLVDRAKNIPKRPLISESPDPNAAPGLRGPIGNLSYKDLKELESKALEHLKDRQGRIESACWEIIEEHIALSALIKKLKLSELPKFLTKITSANRLSLKKSSWNRIKKKIATLPELYNDPDLAGQYILHWIDAVKLHQNTKLISDAISGKLKKTVFKDLTKITYNKNLTYLSDYYLSHLALLACQYLIQIYTGWNPDVVRELTPSSISLDANKSYIVQPFKSKVDQYLQPKYFGENESRPRKVIELLLEHNKSLESNHVRLESSLFVGFQTVLQGFGLFNPKNVHASIIECFELPYFAPSQLRDQVANAIYLESGKDVLALKEYLGHADLQTVETYLNHTIQRVLNEANMSEFIKRLDESITWCVSLNKNEFNNNPITAPNMLLFPVGSSLESCLCDNWIDDESKIEIDANQIAHCIWQREYYIENYNRLRSANPRQFAIIHLPRIIFCTALHHVIMQSKYRYLVEKIKSI